MKNRNFILGFSVFTFLFWTSIAVAQLTLSGEIRPRTEYLHGYYTLPRTDQDPALWTEQRSRLNVAYAAEKYKVGLVLQDIRVWGSTTQLNKTDNFSSFHEIWGEILFTKKISLKLGRQEIIYDDHRIFGNVGWTQQARSHDLAMFKYKNGSLKADIGLAYNQDRTQLRTNIYTTPFNYKTMQYLWAHKDFKDKLGVSFLVLNTGFQFEGPPDTSGVGEFGMRYTQMAGTHIEYKNDKLSVVGSFYYQTGKFISDKNLNAYNFKLEFMYNITKQFSAGAGYEVLSGTSETDTTSTTNNSFTPLFGTNHRFNGYMDYFYVANHINSVGLQDLYFKVQYKKNKFGAGVDVHLFSSAADILDQQEFAKSGEFKALNSSLGTEIDATLKYKFSDAVTFQGGYSHMLGTESLVALKGGDKDEISNWAYLMITFKPVFFKQQEAKPQSE